MAKFILPLAYLLSLFVLEAIRWDMAAGILLTVATITWVIAVGCKFIRKHNQTLHPLSILPHDQYHK